MRKTSMFFGVATLFFASGVMAQAEKVDICHIPPGNPANAHTISVGAAAVPAHVANHGDTACSCEVIADCTEQEGVLDPDTCECELPPPPPVCTADWNCETTFTQCGTSDLGPCICDVTVEGDSFCMGGFSCTAAAPCPNGSIDCPSGQACTTNCCGRTCAPPCQNPGGGQ